MTQQMKLRSKQRIILTRMMVQPNFPAHYSKVHSSNGTCSSELQATSNTLSGGSTDSKGGGGGAGALRIDSKFAVIHMPGTLVSSGFSCRVRRGFPLMQPIATHKK
jgi:hypothetical protein